MKRQGSVWRDFGGCRAAAGTWLLFSLLAAVTLLLPLCVLPAEASAAEPVDYALYLDAWGDIRKDNASGEVVQEGTTLTWDGQTCVLNGLVFSTTAPCAIQFDTNAESVTLRVEGTNTISCSDMRGDPNSMTYAICADGPLAITGSGALTISASSNCMMLSGIKGNTLTIADAKVSVSAMGGGSTMCYGIYCGNLNVQSGSVCVELEGVGAGYGIYANGLSVSGSVCSVANQFGMFVNGNAAVSGGSVFAVGGNAAVSFLSFDGEKAILTGDTETRETPSAAWSTAEFVKNECTFLVDGKTAKSIYIESIKKSEHQHDGRPLEAWTEADSLPTAPGDYYLTRNITLAEQATLTGDIGLCLNGKTITANRGMEVPSGATLSLEDCAGGGSIIVGRPLQVAGGGTLELHGGLVSAKAGAALSCAGSFRMDGGSLRGLELSGDGVITGGSISAADAGSYGIDLTAGTLALGGMPAISGVAADICVSGDAPLSASVDGTAYAGKALKVSWPNAEDGQVLVRDVTNENAELFTWANAPEGMGLSYADATLKAESTHKHVLAEAWETNETHHWRRCVAENCPGLTDSEAEKAHHSGPAATCAEPQKCDVCHADMAPALEHTYRCVFQTDGSWEMVCQVCGSAGKRGKIAVSYYSGVYDGQEHDAVTVTGAPEGSIFRFERSDGGVYDPCTLPRIRDVDIWGMFTKIVVGEAVWGDGSEANWHPVEITPRPWNDMDFTIDAIPDQPYTGREVEPAPVVRFGETVLAAEKDYTLTYPADTVSAGTKTIHVAFRGNFSGETTVTYEVTGEPLTARIERVDGTKHGDWYTGDVTARVLVTGSGIVTWQYTLNGTEWLDGVADSFVITEDGSHTVQIKAMDAAGNEAISEIITVNRDATAPVITNVSVTDADIWTREKTVTFEGRDAASGVANVSVSHNGSEVLCAENAFQVTENGTYTITVTDCAGHSAHADVVVEKIDRAAPAVTVGSPNGELGANDWYVSNVTIPVTVTDDGSATWSYTLDGTTWTDGTGDRLVITKDGNHQVQIKAVDQAGNEAVSEIITVKRDTTAPAIINATVSEADVWTREKTVTFESRDAVSHVAAREVRFGDAATALTEDTFQVTENGTYTITVTDRAGNAASVDVEVKKIDKAAPTVVIGAPSGNMGANDWYIGDVTVPVTVTDDGSATWSYTLDGTTWTDGTGDRLVIAKDGKHKVQIKAMDQAGNVTLTETIAVNRDATAPAITAVAVSDADVWTREKTVTFASDDDASGVASVSVSHNGSEVLCAENTFQATENGTYTIVVTDRAGYAASVDVEVKRIDKAVPTVVIGDPSGTRSDTGWYISNVTIPVTVADDGSATWSYTLDGATWTDGTGDRLVIAKDGKHKAQIKAMDQAGNEVVSEIFTVNRDATAPVITDISLSDADIWTKEKTVTVEIAETGSGVASMATDGGSFVIPCTENTFRAIRNGTYVLTVTDHAGHTVSEFVCVKNVDRSPPYIPYPPESLKAWVKEAFMPCVIKDVESEVVTKMATCNGTEIPLTESGFTAKENGLYVITATDRAGNVLHYEMEIHMIDTEAPMAAIGEIGGNKGANGWYVGDVTVPVTVKDDGEAKWSYTLDDLVWKSGYGGRVAVTVDGTYMVRVKARDSVGNESEPDAVIVKRDATAPIITNVTVSDADIWTREKTVTFEADDAVSGLAGMTVTHNGAVTSLEEHAFRVTESGAYTITATDHAGNTTSETVDVSWVDGTVPSITGVTVSPTEWTNGDVTLTISGAADGGSRLNSKPYSFDGGYTWTSEANMLYTENAENIAIRVRDQAGNVYAHPDISIRNIDKTAPVIALAPTDIDPVKWHGITTFTVTADDGESGLGACRVQADGREIDLTNSAFAATTAGTYTCTATDRAGNMAVISVTIRVEPAIDELTARVAALDGTSSYEDLRAVADWRDSLSQTVRERFALSDAARAAEETLDSLLAAKSREEADRVVTEIETADTIDAILRAEADFLALPADIRGQVEASTQTLLAVKTADARIAREAAQRLVTAAVPGVSARELEGALASYDALTDAQKTLADWETGVQSAWADLTAVSAALDRLGAIQAPYTPATKELIAEAQTAYEALTEGQKALYPEAETLTAWTARKVRAREVEALLRALDAIYDSGSDGDIEAAQAAVDDLSAEELSLVDGQLRTKLAALRQAMLDTRAQTEQAAAAFSTQVEAVRTAPTVEKIRDLEVRYDRLSQAAKDLLSEQTKELYETLRSDLAAAKPVVDALSGIDPTALTPGDLGRVREVLSAWDGLTEAQQGLTDGAKRDTLDRAVRDCDAVTAALAAIPAHGGQEPPALRDCGSFGHTADDHRQAVETAEQTFRALSVAGRGLLGGEAPRRLQEERQAVETYLASLRPTRPGGGPGSSADSGSTTVKAPEHGRVELSVKHPKRGDTVRVTPKPDRGWTVARVVVTDRTGRKVEVTAGDGVWTFVQPRETVTVRVIFRLDIPLTPQQTTEMLDAAVQSADLCGRWLLPLEGVPGRMWETVWQLVTDRVLELWTGT